MCTHACLIVTAAATGYKLFYSSFTFFNVYIFAQFYLIAQTWQKVNSKLNAWLCQKASVFCTQYRVELDDNRTLIVRR